MVNIEPRLYPKMAFAGAVFALIGFAFGLIAFRVDDYTPLFMQPVPDGAYISALFGFCFGYTAFFIYIAEKTLREMDRLKKEQQNETHS